MKLNLLSQLPFQKYWKSTRKASISLTLLASAWAASGMVSGQSAGFRSEVADAGAPVGTSAHELLSDTNYDDLLIEIQAVKGFEPSPGALEKLKSFLGRYLRKRIHFEQAPLILSPADEGQLSYTQEQVRQIERLYRKRFSGGRTLVAYLLYLDRPSDLDQAPHVFLGHAYQNSSIAIYGSTLVNQTGPGSAYPKEQVEASALAHEFGHLLGLVGAGSPMQQEHMSEDHHCTSLCLMDDDLMKSIQGAAPGQIPELDSECKKDLKSNGGRTP